MVAASAMSWPWGDKQTNKFPKWSHLLAVLVVLSLVAKNINTIDVQENVKMGKNAKNFLLILQLKKV